MLLNWGGLYLVYAGHGISTRRNQCFKLLCASVSFSILCAKLAIPTFGSRHIAYCGRLHTANDATTTTTTITLMMAAMLTYVRAYSTRKPKRTYFEYERDLYMVSQRSTRYDGLPFNFSTSVVWCVVPCIQIRCWQSPSKTTCP